MTDWRIYRDQFNGPVQEASSSLLFGVTAGENASSAFDFRRLEAGQDYDVTIPASVAIAELKTALEPKTSTPARHDNASAEPLASGSQEPDMDETTEKWINAKLETAQERTNTQLANMQRHLDTGVLRLENQIRMISDNVQRLADTIKGIHDDGSKISSEIDHLSNKIDEAEKETRKELYEIKSQNTNMQLQNASMHTSMLTWYVGTTIVLFLTLVAVATFGKDMFEWGRNLSQ